MKHIGKIILVALMALMPLSSFAGHEAGSSGEMNISETVLEHLSDSYEWHIASYEGKHLSIPLPIIVRSGETGEWTFCTAHTLPANF